ncbi:MAG: hypothetical protein KDD65_04745 [Bacteroidetes bacterium]|nr:hypothetical protein [Bacteroidota bacterium]
MWLIDFDRGTAETIVADGRARIQYADGDTVWRTFGTDDEPSLPVKWRLE